jgi:hypothetical protein
MGEIEMKTLKFFSLLLVVILLSCAPNIKQIPSSLSIYEIDFSKYSEMNFLFTPYKYLGDYKSIGLVSVTYMPEANFEQVVTGKGTGVEELWKIENVNLENIIEAFHKKAINMGANAVVDLTIENIPRTIYAATPVTISGVKLSGFAIKRLGAFK